MSERVRSVKRAISDLLPFASLFPPFPTHQSTSQPIKSVTSYQLFTDTFSSFPSDPQRKSSSELAPPPVPTRPERTKSVYTKPVDETDGLQPPPPPRCVQVFCARPPIVPMKGLFCWEKGDVKSEGREEDR